MADPQGPAIREGRLLVEKGRLLITTKKNCPNCCPEIEPPAECTCTSTLPGGLSPGLSITLTWTGPQATREWAFLVWTNGETKVLCCQAYICQRATCSPTVSYGREQCTMGNTATGYTVGGIAGGGIDMTAFLSPFCVVTGTPPLTLTDRIAFLGVETATTTAILKLKYLTFYFGGTYGYSTRSNISTDNFGTYATNFTQADGLLEPGHFGGGATGQVTDTNGITYQWTQDPICPGLGTLC